MDKTLQTTAWNCLPREFKEEVKETYREYTEKIAAKSEPEYRVVGYIAAQTELELLFGYHNLTPDAEGEEMLIVSRKEIQQLVAANDIVILKAAGIDNIETIQAKTVNTILNRLFGSKCLPDEAQPKQKDCDNPLADKEGCRWRNDGKCVFDSACYFESLNPQEPKPADALIAESEKEGE